MAKGNKKNVEEVEEIKNDSKAILSSSLKENKDSHYNFCDTVTWQASTGSLTLDAETGGIKPSLWRFCGNNNSGKTPQLLECMRNIFISVPKSKGLWFPSEGRGLSDENKARCGLKFVYKAEEWDYGTIFVYETNIFEVVINTIKSLVLGNEEKNVYAFAIDSIDGLILRDDAAKEIDGNNRVAGVPMLSKKMLQSLSLGMFKHGHWMGLVSQVTSEIKLDPYTKTANRGGNFSGGNSLLHGSDFILTYEPSFGGDFILDDPAGKFNDGKTKAIGQNVRVVLAKSVKEASKKKAFTYPIKYGRKLSGIWVEREIGDVIFMFGLAKKAGAGWITFDSAFLKEIQEISPEISEKIQGFDNFYAIFESNPQLTEYLKNKFIKMLLV